MKRKLFIFSILLFVGTTLSAQIKSLHIGASDNSIVRMVNDTFLLIYTEDPLAGAHFLWYDITNASTMAFQLPGNIQIRDVKIHNGIKAYFCGTYNNYSTQEAIVGTFDIPAVFPGGGNVYFGQIQGNNPENLIPRDLKRLELFTVSNTVCMAMVGDAEFGGNPLTTVVSAYWDGTQWNSWMLLHKGDAGFTDITCLDHMVVAAGTFFADTGCIVKTFRPTLDFPCQGFDTYFSHHFLYGTPMGKVLIDKEVGDTAVLVHFNVPDKVNTLFQRTAFSASNGVPVSPATAIETVPASTLSYGNNWEMLELTATEDNAFLLQRAAYPMLFDPNVIDYRLSVPLPFPSSIEAWSPLMSSLQSMDVTAAKWISSTGGNLLLHGPGWASFGNECHLYHWIETSPADIAVERMVLHSYGVISTTHFIPWSASTFSVDADDACNLRLNETETR